ncbi:hypothetical protein CAI21_08370 [Alkalilimnicola ehrlichii]|uniref:DUF4168 domain-containing protein n=1 Tax=Alkalilimnicola ehrlichii TaxID=351052 RepID=A0A3E0WVK4_9GAMM|nr:DUF4168 domain-containing protein [Alkalilimnicola ehrlichii]RFA29840.1 hypothetical protein CAI21_08370 [Alkalilimnicola ehrlichii]RFA36429.1 hypothetical protein CAL65_10640 [Alkalilimnicola ehrlichii]
MRNIVTYTSRAAVLSLLLAAPMAFAQGTMGAQGQQEAPAQTYEAPTGQQQAADFSDDSLNQFADSYVDILDIQQDFTARLEGAEDPEQAQQLQQEANEEMVQAIEDNGLSVQEYTEIARAMDTDPELRQQVVELVTARR